LIDKEYEEILAKYVEKVLYTINPLGIILFGSHARGEAKKYPESDIDLLIIAENLPENLIERRMMLLKLKQLSSLLEDIWLTPKELREAIEGGWGMVLDALDEGIILYDPEGILEKAKESVHKLYLRIGGIWIRKTLRANASKS